MPKPTRSQAERKADSAAERRVHGAILGYQPLRMKPVHFATSFLLALTGRYYRLEYLNKASVLKLAPKDTARVRDEYPSERLHPLLVELGRLDPAVDLEAFRTLRAHLGAAYNNDGAALAACFDNYSTFGADYSAPSTRYISNKSKNHGHSGSFVLAVFQANPLGLQALSEIRELLDLPPPPLAALGTPLLDDDDEPWVDQYDELFGPIDPARVTEIAARMSDVTAAIRRLAANLRRQRSSYALRYLILGLCCWLFTYILRQSTKKPLLLIDALQGRNPRIRAQSRSTYARLLDQFSSSYDRAFARQSSAGPSEADWNVFATSVDARQILDEHFRDLGVRIGIIQPRSAVAKHKHVELQADTLRMLALSLLDDGQVLTMTDFSHQLYQTWSLVVGAGPHDGELLRSNRFGPLDRDDDLRPNAVAFEGLMVRLGLAVEPSDGLTLVAINAEELI
jgi:hypothetical protein